MKYAFCIILIIFFVGNGFSQEQDTPSVYIELNSGYAIGVNLPNALPLEVKIVYPFSRFGFTLEGGTSLFLDGAPLYHVFFGPTVFIINNPKIRVPISIGFDLMGHTKDQYIGVGGIVSFNYSLNKNLYAGINLEINYGINHPYDEIVGYRDAAIGVDEGGNKIYPMDGRGNPIKTTPVKENKNHFEDNILIKPTLAIGLQF